MTHKYDSVPVCLPIQFHRILYQSDRSATIDNQMMMPHFPCCCGVSIERVHQRVPFHPFVVIVIVIVGTRSPCVMGSPIVDIGIRWILSACGGGDRIVSRRDRDPPPAEWDRRCRCRQRRRCILAQILMLWIIAAIVNGHRTSTSHSHATAH